MAAVVDNSGEAVEAVKNNDLVVETTNLESKEFNVQKLVDMFTKLNPLAKEFFPSSYHHDQTQKTDNFDPTPVKKQSAGNENFSNKRSKNNLNQGRRRLNGRAFRVQRDDSIKRTVYVSDIDQTITEEQLAGLFSNCGQVVDCRVCGNPHSALRFAFVEFADEGKQLLWTELKTFLYKIDVHFFTFCMNSVSTEGAGAALNIDGTMLGFYPVRVLPSKTAILPVNPTFLPRSEDEREMCTRTVYCTNIAKKVSQAEVKNFFESTCGQVTRLRLLGDQVHSTRIAFVEFAMAESAIIALNCSGMVLGTQPIRVSPSKTPVRPRVTRLD
ncbi:Polyadenylate-binding protein-interacting protein 9 [Hibiscus syriacus]|uniref:Polyadenylate-binding protein-interacting protein 9 n=1 Tax=Hibiscus syriacus TaxID=106335 RepID=A0A6A2ZIH1_HIBSY|nr:Polyadenylate-binding protein-interacting protein 9 [Hibiscus syriacus]